MTKTFEIDKSEMQKKGERKKTSSFGLWRKKDRRQRKRKEES